MSIRENAEVGEGSTLDNLLTGGKEALAEITERDEWDVSVTRHPLEERVTVRITVEVDVLTHHVQVVPEETAPARSVAGEESFHGHRIEHWHSATPEDGERIIEDGIHGQMRAFRLAREEMERIIA